MWTRGVDPNLDNPSTNGQQQKRTEGCGEREAATYRIGAEELQLVRHDLQVT